MIQKFHGIDLLFNMINYMFYDEYIYLIYSNLKAYK